MLVSRTIPQPQRRVHFPRDDIRVEKGEDDVRVRASSAATACVASYLLRQLRSAVEWSLRI